MRVPVALKPLQYWIFSVFKKFSHSKSYVVLSHCCFALQLPNDIYCWASFHMIVCLLYLILFFVFLKLIYFNWKLVTLQYCSGFRHTLTWISHRHTCVPHPEHPSHFPSCPIPQGHPSTPALSTLSHALNLDCKSASHMIIYTFQCYPLKSSHPCLLPQSPKDCFIYLCLFCCLTYRIIITIFLNSYICISILYWCFSFWLTSLCIMGYSFIHLIRTDSNAFFLMAE